MTGDPATNDPPRVELYVRSLAPTDIRDKQEQVLERLTHLDADDTIANFEVVVCGETVCPSSVTAETKIGQRLLARHRMAKQWAENRNRDLVGFEQHGTDTTIAGTIVAGVSFPRMLLIEFRADSPSFVAPSRNGSETTSISDRLDFYDG
ncbi:HTH domain-containing protein [Halovenus sp. HT40]|uniref:HTH domain-containing protein n=1 Tax=Halovenus sp. HT40 TaxID=3126691 RepID=UPI00300F76B6